MGRGFAAEGSSMRGGSGEVGGGGGGVGGGRLLLVVAAESEAEAVLRGFSPPFRSVPISPSARSPLAASSVVVDGGDEGRSALLAGACRAGVRQRMVLRRAAGGGGGGGVVAAGSGFGSGGSVGLRRWEGNAAGAVGWCFGLMGGGGGGLGVGWGCELGIGVPPVLGDGGDGPAKIGDVVIGSASVYGDEVVLPVGAVKLMGLGL